MAEPLKWLKYLKLVEAGLLRQDWLLEEIRRYQRKDIDRLLVDVKDSLEQDSRNSRNCLYVIKAISVDEYRQLPNCRVINRNEYGHLSEFLTQVDWSKYVEAWWCRTPIGNNILSIAGRLLINSHDMPGHIVELIWRNSPRLLDARDLPPGSTVLLASRPTWGWHYEIAEQHSTIGGGVSREIAMQEFRVVMLELEIRREQIELMGREFELHGLSVYSFEFKMVGSQFFVIDWDTADDKKVLRAF